MEEKNMNNEIEELKQEIEQIKKRNARVEADKAWETSIFRVLTIAVLTFIVMSVILYSIGVEDVLLNAIITIISYYLSTLTFSFLKNWWIKNRYSKN